MVDVPATQNVLGCSCLHTSLAPHATGESCACFSHVLQPATHHLDFIQPKVHSIYPTHGDPRSDLSTTPTTSVTISKIRRPSHRDSHGMTKSGIDTKTKLHRLPSLQPFDFLPHSYIFIYINIHQIHAHMTTHTASAVH